MKKILVFFMAVLALASMGACNVSQDSHDGASSEYSSENAGNEQGSEQDNEKNIIEEDPFNDNWSHEL